MIFDIDTIKSYGYIPTEYVEYNKVGTYWFMRKSAIKMNVTLDSVKSFRIAEDTWQIFLKPEYEKGFKDQALLNF